MSKPLVTAEELRTLLSYDPATGKFVWKVKRNSHGGSMLPGDEAGHVADTGYRLIGLNGRLYRAHRLAWLYVFGAWPAKMLDHINGNRADNRLSNLREVTVAENAQNTWRSHKDSATGFLGVHKGESAFVATICKGGKKQHLGSFRTAEAAHAAYLAAKTEVHSAWGRT